MSKKIILLITILYISIGYSQSLFKGKVTYSVKNAMNIELIQAKLDSVKNKEQKKTLLKGQELIVNSQDVYATLVFNNIESVYKVEESLRNEAKNTINITRSRAGGNKTYYYNNKTKENVEQEYDILGEYFLIQNPITEWKLENESKKIGDYVCFKATTMLNIVDKSKATIAWYTPDIPVNFGPKLFNNLPGLVLEVNTGGITFKAIKIELNPNYELKIEKPRKGKKVTKKEYMDILKKYMPEFFKRD